VLAEQMLREVAVAATDQKLNPYLALTSAALALPAIAVEQPIETQLSLQVASYQEDALPASDNIAGSLDRYDISTYYFRLNTPVADQYGLDVRIDRELMSGASPWGTGVAVDGSQSLLMSGASIKDSRTAGSVTLTRYEKDYAYSLALGTSEEDDYQSRSIKISGEWELNSGLASLSTSLSASNDKLLPSDAALFNRVPSANKENRSFYLGWGQVINANTTLHLGATVSRYTGYLSDPYKLLDRRPDEKDAIALTSRLRYWLSSPQAALHLDYRYYSDSFEVDSHTFTVQWHQNIGTRLQLVPMIRFYQQSAASFYSPSDNYTLSPTVAQSSDFRLSEYTAVSSGLKAIYKNDNWSFNVRVERYKSDSDHASNLTSHRALLDFTLVSGGVTWAF